MTMGQLRSRSRSAAASVGRAGRNVALVGTRTAMAMRMRWGADGSSCTHARHGRPRASSRCASAKSGRRDSQSRTLNAPIADAKWATTIRRTGAGIAGASETQLAATSSSVRPVVPSRNAPRNTASRRPTTELANVAGIGASVMAPGITCARKPATAHDKAPDRSRTRSAGRERWAPDRLLGRRNRQVWCQMPASTVVPSKKPLSCAAFTCAWYSPSACIVSNALP